MGRHLPPLPELEFLRGFIFSELNINEENMFYSGKETKRAQFKETCQSQPLPLSEPPCYLVLGALL